MGEVYRATDMNLGRDVAIKVLPAAFAQEAERLARFEREAKTLATLNHPNIAIVHGFEKAGEIRALVMELVEGPTLADRIAHGPIAIDEAIPIARQIAKALEAAQRWCALNRSAMRCQRTYRITFVCCCDVASRRTGRSVSATYQPRCSS